MSKAVDYTSMSDDDLRAASEGAAAERTAVRLKQNAIQAEIEIRQKLSEMSGAARDAIKLRLGGGTTPAGKTTENAR